MDLMLEENPLGFYHRRHRKHHRRNPMGLGSMKTTAREWAQGIDLTDVAAGLAGFAAAAMIPGMLITAATTTTQKVLKLAIAAGSALAVGAMAKSFVGGKAGQSAIIGGLSGTAAQAVNAFTPWKIGGNVAQPVMALPVAHPVASRPIGRYPAPADKTGFANIRIT